MTVSATTPATTRISGPEELISAIPYLLGFHPAESVVLVGLAGSIVTVTARLDLPSVGVHPQLAQTVAAMRRGGATRLLGVVYTDRGPGDMRPAGQTVDAIIDAAAEADVEIGDLLLVAGERWWSYGCTQPTCCPPEGRRVEPADSAFVAQATFDGIAVLPDRAAVDRCFEPAPAAERWRVRAPIAQHERAAVAAAVRGEAERWRRAAIRAIFAAARRADRTADTGAPTPVSDDVAARFAVALREIAVRDSLWMGVDDQRIDGRALWLDLARRVPEPYGAAPLFLYGWASWRSGNGAMAGMAAERAIASDPAYSAADLLLAALSGGLDPRTFPKLRGTRSR